MTLNIFNQCHNLMIHYHLQYEYAGTVIIGLPEICDSVSNGNGLYHS
jgi:hypothetical protein